MSTKKTKLDVPALVAEVRRLREDTDRSTDWYQQRFNRLRKWVDEEVRPLSREVATHYHSICANGSAVAHESADWSDTMHGLRLRAGALVAEVRRLQTALRKCRRAAKHPHLSPGTLASLVENLVDEALEVVEEK